MVSSVLLAAVHTRPEHVLAVRVPSLLLVSVCRPELLLLDHRHYWAASTDWAASTNWAASTSLTARAATTRYLCPTVHLLVLVFLHPVCYPLVPPRLLLDRGLALQLLAHLL